ncbi:predicted protein [Botrytis cinerea T4]|uniref:Uncharacterized protein n=1 Tax=Botryotinia fuckeliana (strain T4) TaxID=999810 RepID=G2Y3R9_BOTF4|nr:predicted protein [Botrytis cinerea T4]
MQQNHINLLKASVLPKTKYSSDQSLCQSPKDDAPFPYPICRIWTYPMLRDVQQKELEIWSIKLR